MATISLDVVKSLVNYLTIKGIDRQSLLNAIDTSEQQLNQSGELIDANCYEALYQLAEQQLGSTHIGFDFGQIIEADRWGLLGYIAFTSPSPKAAIANQRKYQTLAGDIGAPLQQSIGDNIILKWMPSYRCSHHISEEIISSWAAMANKLSNNNIAPAAIYFSHPPQAEIRLYQSFFGCEVHFSADFNGIEIERYQLDTPYVRHEPEIYHLLCQQADKRLNHLVEKLPVEIITQYIANQLPHGVPEIEEAAQNLQMSVRTLQRKLSEHQLTFSGLIDSIRQALAISYLTNTDTKIIYISQLLGFSEQSAFQRAFKRWTQTTPKQFRTDNHQN